MLSHPLQASYLHGPFENAIKEHGLSSFAANIQKNRQPESLHLNL